MSRVLVALALLTFPAAGCWVPIEQGQAMEADLVRLKAEMADTRRELEQSELRASRERDRLRAEQDAALRKIDSKIKEVGEALESLNRSARKTGADLGVEVEQAQAEIARLRGLLEESQARYATFEQSLNELRADTDSRLSATDERLKAWEASRRAAETVPPNPAGGAVVVKEPEKPLTKEAHYELAKSTLDAGERTRARALFTDFLRKYPTDALAVNAQYWLGESLYAEKAFPEAITEFRKVWERWPKADKAPDAVLKIGYSFLGLGNVDNARLFLEEVSRTWPKAPAAKLAKEKLDELAKQKR